MGARFKDMKLRNDCIQSWFDDPKRYRGASKKNVEYLRTFRELEHDNAVIGTLTYFLVTRLDIYSARTMLVSAQRQKKFIMKVIIQLKEWIILPYHEPWFDKDIAGLKRRKDTVFRICKENIKLTKHYPYFDKVGFEKLFDFDTKYVEGDGSVLDVLIPDMEAWEAEHADEVEAYLLKIQPDLERRAAFLKRKEEALKQEKEERKAQKKAEREEMKMIREANKAELKRRKELNKDLERTIRRTWGNG